MGVRGGEADVAGGGGGRGGDRPWWTMLLSFTFWVYEACERKAFRRLIFVIARTLE